MRSERLNESDEEVLIDAEDPMSNKTPFLIDKHLQRDSIVFEYMTHVPPVVSQKSLRTNMHSSMDGKSDLAFPAEFDESVLYNS